MSSRPGVSTGGVLVKSLNTCSIDAHVFGVRIGVKVPIVELGYKVHHPHSPRN